jgi:hypothetical protein
MDELEEEIRLLDARERAEEILKQKLAYFDSQTELEIARVRGKEGSELAEERYYDGGTTIGIDSFFTKAYADQAEARFEILGIETKLNLLKDDYMTNEIEINNLLAERYDWMVKSADIGLDIVDYEKQTADLISEQDFLDNNISKSSLIKEYQQNELDAAEELLFMMEGYANRDANAIAALIVQIQKLKNEMAKGWEGVKVWWHEMEDDEKGQVVIDAIDKLNSSMFDGVNELLSATLSAKDTELDEQARRIETAISQAEYGNSRLVEIEKNKYNELLKDREEAVRKQERLNKLEMLSNAALAITQAVVSGKGNPILIAVNIAAALASLGFGIAASQQKINGYSFFEGGFTGDGNPRSESSALGNKPYTYHKGEFVMDNAVTSLGNNKAIFQQILDGRVDLDKAMNNDNVILAQGGGFIQDNSDIIKAIQGMPEMSVRIDKDGIVAITEKKRFKNNRRNKAMNYA